MVVDTARYTLLVIDDERGPRESLRILFKNEYDVICADSVDEGLEHLRTAKPDLVVLDIRMPDKTGIDGLREIRRIDQEVSVIMLTGFGALETAQEALRLGANDYIKKPFDKDEMEALVHRHIKGSHFRRRRLNASHELQELNRRLVDELGDKERLAAIGQASAEFVHDLRNPLTIVLGYVGLLSGELAKAKETIADESQEALDYLDIIEKNVKRCHELAQLWSNLNKNDPCRMQPMKIDATINDIIRGAEALAKERNAVIEGSIEETSCLVNVDDVQIFRAISNLVVNAIHALPNAGGRVLVTCHEEETYVEICVIDNGCGIEQEKIDRIFDAHYTDNKAGGSGLGLFIAKRVIEDHDGSIAVESQIDKGTTFKIRLPKHR